MTATEMTEIGQRMFDTPLMIDAGKAAVIAQAMTGRIFGTDARIEVAGAQPGRFDMGANVGDPPKPAASLLGDELASELIAGRYGYANHKGVAIIPVMGTLVRRGAWIGQSSGMTSYEGLGAQLRAAAADSDVKAIALEIASPGGEAAGMFQMAELVRAINAEVPVHAFLADYAYSAAYGIASGARRITVPEFGGAGSIGVIMMHAEFSKALEKDGITVSIIRSGAEKAKGNQVEPLPDGLRDEWQASCDRMWTRFAAEVVAGRDNGLTIDAILKMEARCFEGQEAVDRGLADAVAEAKPAFDALVEEVNSPGGHVTVGIAAGTGAALSAPHTETPQKNSSAEAAPVAAAGDVDRSPGCTIGAQAPSTEEVDMDDQTQEPVAAEAPETVSEAPAPSTPQADDTAARITAAVARAGLSAQFAADLIAEGVDFETAQGRIIDAFADGKADGGDIRNVSTARITDDVVDRTRRGLTGALLQRAGMEGGQQTEFSGMSLREMARETLKARNMAVPQGGVSMMIGAALAPAMMGGMHGTSDFGNILADVANKSMQRGFEEEDETFELFTSTGSMSDFKPTRRVGLDAFPNLLKVEEGAEFQHGTMGDYGETATLATYGRLFSISRQAIINDDLDAFTRVPARMGRAAKRTVGDLVFSILSGNPTMADGTALFHADHNNLAGTGGAPSEASFNAAYTAMATHKDRSGSATALNIRPAYVIAGHANRSAILQTLNSEHAPDDTAKSGTAKQSRAANTAYKMVTPIFDARITGNEWFMSADAKRYDAIEVSYLDGVAAPFMEQMRGWEVDGTEFKVRIDAVAKALAYETLYKNAGA